MMAVSAERTCSRPSRRETGDAHEDAARLRRTRDMIINVADVLEAAEETARRRWDKNRCDVYHCCSRAWRAQGMIVPLAAVTSSVRRLVPDGKLMAFQDRKGRTRADIAQLFLSARETLMANSAQLLGPDVLNSEAVGAHR